MQQSDKRYFLDGKVAIVTGATGVLGKEFCRGLARSGARVVVVDLNEDDCQQLATELNQDFNVPTLAVACDVRSEESVIAMHLAVLDQLGKVDILHNNAAWKTDNLSQFFAPFEEYSLATWREVMSVNIDGMFLVAKTVGAAMAQRGRGGTIIQTSSIYGVSAPDPRIYKGSNYLGCEINTPGVYCASKAAVVGLTQYLATYWANKGIRVNTLTPGGVQSGQNSRFVEQYSARVPLGRMATPADIVNGLLFLASDESQYITGQNLVIDGGLTAW